MKKEDFVRPFCLAMERRQRFGVYFIFKSPEQRGDNRPDSDVDFLVDMGPAEHGSI